MALIQTVVPAYRLALIEMLRRGFEGDLLVYCGERFFDPTVSTAIGADVVPVSNRYLAGRRLLWQHRAVRHGIQADHAILELNPRILSNWCIAIARRCRGRPTVVFGHAFGRHGGGVMSNAVRYALELIAGRVAVYSEPEAGALRDRHPNLCVTWTGNALYTGEQAGPAPLGDALDLFVVSGRMVAAKKPMLALDAFTKLRRDVSGPRLVFIGDGPCRMVVERAARASGLRIPEDVGFHGRIDGFVTLRKIYAEAVATISPGYAGLSLIQSHWFGIRMLIADMEPHGPEIAAVEGRTNAEWFEADNADALADIMRYAWSRRRAWAGERGNIARRCAARYSIEVMADRLLGVATCYCGHGDGRT